MSELDPDHAKREVRTLTVVFLLIGLSAVVSAEIPAVEAFLDLWVPVVIGAALAVAAVVSGIKRLAGR